MLAKVRAQPLGLGRLRVGSDEFNHGVREAEESAFGSELPVTTSPARGPAEQSLVAPDRVVDFVHDNRRVIESRQHASQRTAIRGLRARHVARYLGTSGGTVPQFVKARFVSTRKFDRAV